MMRVVRFLMVCLFTLGPFAVGASVALADKPIEAKIQYAGLFLVDDTSLDFRSVQETDQIPAELGQVFGIYYVLTRDSRRPVRVREVIRNNDGATSERVLVVPDAANILAFGFDETEELIEGDWTFELYYEQTLLASQQFNISTQHPVPSGPLDGVVTSICKHEKRTGSHQRFKICEPRPLSR